MLFSTDASRPGSTRVNATYRTAKEAPFRGEGCGATGTAFTRVVRLAHLIEKSDEDICSRRQRLLPTDGCLLAMTVQIRPELNFFVVAALKTIKRLG